MDHIVDSLNKAYEKFLLASASVFEAKAIANGERSSLTDAALEDFKDKWQLFRVACDQAEEFVDLVKHRIGSESLVDKDTGLQAGNSGQSAAVTSSIVD